MLNVNGGNIAVIGSGRKKKLNKSKSRMIFIE
jgi:hypothetical protein